jgi:hypothetical protein
MESRFCPRCAFSAQAAEQYVFLPCAGNSVPQAVQGRIFTDLPVSAASKAGLFGKTALRKYLQYAPVQHLLSMTQGHSKGRQPYS